MKAAVLLLLLAVITVASTTLPKTTTMTMTHNMMVSSSNWSPELEKELGTPLTLSELAQLPICNQAAPPERLSPGSSVSTDTIGQLVSSQFMWRLPGLDHAMHGFDVLTGGEKTKPIFLFCYPKENVKTRRLEDPYRGNAYMLPDGVFANAAPQCSYSMDTQSFTSSQDMAQSMMDSSDLSASAGGGGGAFGFSFSARAAYSQHSSVASALTAQSSKGGSLQLTTVQCITSRVKLAYNFTFWHPSFVQAMMGVNDQTDLFQIMLEYGTHFYSSFELGGQLSQVSSTATEHSATSSESEMQTNAEASFSASASGWGMSAEASGSYATSHGMKVSNQEEYEAQTSKSDVMTLGGALGSFGPAGPGATDSPTNWGAWAQTVDLLPIPMNYKLRCLYEIIPDTWTNQNGSKTIKDLWKAAAGQFSRHIELEAMKAMLGGKNIYTIFIQTGASIPEAGAGPYLFSLAGSDASVTMPNIFFTEQMSLGASRKAPPYTITHPHRFWPNSTFVFEHMMPDLNELKTITLCDTSTTIPPITMATKLSSWGIQCLHVEDKYRGSVRYFQPAFTGDAACQTFSPISKIPGITILYTIGASNDPNDESPGLVLEFTFEGTSTYKKYYSTSGDALPLKKGQRMSFNFPFSKTDKDLGSIMSVKMELQAPYYWFAGENTPMKFQRGIESTSFRVYYTYGDQTEAYEIASSPSLLKSISPGIPAVFYLQLV